MSLSPSESYNLRWGEFQGHLLQSLNDLREGEYFLDVTLVLDDDRSLEAHKVILSAASSYFRNVLKKYSENTKCLLCMPPETRFQDLASLLEFMYLGEVSVNQDDIDSFMALAKVLKVKGLTQETEVPPPSLPSLPPPPPVRGPKYNPPRQRPLPEKRARRFDDEEGTHGLYNNSYYEEEGLENNKINSGTKLMGLICPECRTLCHGVKALKDHMAHDCPASASFHPNGEYQQVMCNICDKTFKNQKSMLAHQKRLHKIGGSTEESVSVAVSPGMMSKKRGRPSKKATQPLLAPGMEEEEEEEGGRYAESIAPQSNIVVSQGPSSSVRPVVQVPPAPRPSQEDHSRQSSPRGEGMINNASPMVQTRAPPLLPRGPQRFSTPNSFRKNQQQPPLSAPPMRGRPPAPTGSRNMDLKKIGLKLGGQISITSSENDNPVGSPSGSLPNGGNKLTITKFKGDHPIGSPLSIKEATSRRSQSGELSSVEVKEEPTEYGENNGEDTAYVNSYGETQGNYMEDMDGTSSTERLEEEEGEYGNYAANQDEDMEGTTEYIPTSHLGRRYANASQNNPNNYSTMSEEYPSEGK